MKKLISVKSKSEALSIESFLKSYNIPTVVQGEESNMIGSGFYSLQNIEIFVHEDFYNEADDLLKNRPQEREND